MLNNISVFFALIFIVNILIIWKIKYFLKLFNIYDIPNLKRKIHKKPTGLLGGLILFFNTLLFFVYFWFVEKSYINVSFFITENKPLIYFLTFITITFLIGLYDDKYNLSAITRLLLISALILLYLSVDNTSVLQILKFKNLSFKIEFDIGARIFTYLCLIVLLISCNMFDGINLQSFLFYFINFLFLFYLENNIYVLLIILSLIVFGILNHQKKIFLGDSGVYFLSIILGLIYIKYYNFNISNIKADTVFFMLYFPILDASRCILNRIIKGKNPFYGDQIHFHYLLLKKYNYQKTIQILLFFIIFPPLCIISKINILFGVLLISTIYLYFIFLCSKK